MGPRLVAALGAVLVLTAMFELLRRRQLREKYAVLWLFVGFVVAVLGVVPNLLDQVSRLLGIATPVNLLFFTSILVLLVVSVHLSWEASRLEEETHTLAEEVALLRLKLDQLSESGFPPQPPGDATD